MPSDLFPLFQKAMKEAFDLFMKDNEYEKYCQLTYSRDSSDPECSVPISPLIMYYASEWDNEMVAASIETLKIEENRELFNILGLCFGRGVYCDLIPDDISAADTLLALSLANNLTTIIESWDMKGELVNNITQATEFAGYLKEVEVFKGAVDFSAPPASASLEIRAEDGTVVYREDHPTGLPSGRHEFTWDGTTLDGSAIAPIGDYTVVLSANDGTGQGVAATTSVANTVTGVELDENGVTLVMGDTRVPIDQARSVSVPGL